MVHVLFILTTVLTRTFAYADGGCDDLMNLGKNIADIEAVHAKIERPSVSGALFEYNLAKRDVYFIKLVGKNVEELEAYHREAFTALMAGSPLLSASPAYDLEALRESSLASALYESLARTPGESLSDRVQAGRGKDASMGPFQAYAGMTAEALSKHSVREWIRSHGDDESKAFVKSLGGGATKEDIEKALTGVRSPIHSSMTLSLLGKMRLTQGYQEEVDLKNPMVRKLPKQTQKRIWADVESASSPFTDWDPAGTKKPGEGKMEALAKAKPGTVVEVPPGHPRLLKTMDTLGISYRKSNDFTLPHKP